MIEWHYYYSPRYAVWHHILSHSLCDSKDFQVVAHFRPQSLFSDLYKDPKKHFLGGNTVKYDILIPLLKDNPGKQYIFSDVDLIVKNPSGLAKYLEKFKSYDLVFMRERMEDNDINPGIALFKSSPAVIDFLERTVSLMIKENIGDITIFHRLLPQFTGTYTTFDIPQIVQSNMRVDPNSWFVCQALCSQKTYEANMAEKLLSACQHMDIMALKPWISVETWNTFVAFHVAMPHSCKTFRSSITQETAAKFMIQ